jgi:hypothetical protein
VYSVSHYITPRVYTRDILLVVLDSTWINIENEYIRFDINKKLKSKKLKLVFTEFSGVNVGKNKPLNTVKFQEYFPEATFLSGVETVFDLTRTSSVTDILNVIQKTDTIIAGRYHAVVLSKVFNVPVLETYNYCNYKMISETKGNTSDCLNQLQTVFKYIETDTHFKNSNWNDTDRNTVISSINNKKGIAVNLLQNWTNRTLEEFYIKI